MAAERKGRTRPEEDDVYKCTEVAAAAAPKGGGCSSRATRSVEGGHDPYSWFAGTRSMADV